MSEQKRLFFAVNLPEEIKREISEKLLSEIPKDKWHKVKEENLHITMRFLGYLPREAINELKDKVVQLAEFDSFEAELSGIGHFRNRVLWIGTGRGTDELNLLSKKLCSALGVREDRFHAHVTLARNKGSRAKETDALIEILRKKGLRAKIQVNNIELMESILHAAGPEYKRAFSISFRVP